MKIPYRVLDIDKKDEAEIGDSLVRNYGDYSEDYLIPQVFFEYPNGEVKHVFTGFSEATTTTKKHWDDFFSSNFYKSLKR